jgi:flagellar motor switch protein FliN/FliY
LMVLLTFGQSGLAVALPESSGQLPAWYASPDPAGESKLSTLAQELSMLLVPKTLAADKFEARRVPSLSEALTTAGAAADAALVAIAVESGASAGTLSLVWPLMTPAATFEAGASAAGAAEQPSPATEVTTESSRKEAPRGAKGPSLGKLPHYSRSLLKIRIPVSVQLASKKETVQEVVELVPGAIIKFDKGCDELLHMVIGGQAVAEGEAVKIGDKFGFRVIGMLMPREHFVPVHRPRAG